MTTTQWEYKFMNDIDGKHILDIFSEMLVISSELESLPDNSFSLLEKLLEYLSSLDTICAGMEALKLKSLYDKQLKNVIFSIDKIKTAIKSGDKNTALSIAKYQLTPFLIELREEIYFWAYIFPWPDRRNIYYKTEFANHHINEYQANPKYEVSIFVPAKDKLEYTKQCVESILRHTNKNSINYELILINHGSKDNTQEYFESIPEAKLIHFEENVRMIMFTTAMRVCEGKYMAFVSNDTVVTKDWLELLMHCLRSDSSAISATPTTPNVANYQGTPESYTNMQEMDKYAAEFNHHNPLKWESRARILPVIALYDIDKVNKIGFGDRYFQTMEYWDDDFSLRARRAGFKQYLCRDVFCHHYGSITGGEARRKENTLQKGRQLFITKYGIDPWGNGFIYDYEAMWYFRLINQPLQSHARILGIDCGFGDTPLQIANIYKSKNITSEIDNITMQKEYAEDLNGISDHSILVDSEQSLLCALENDFVGKQYSCIYISKPLEQYMNWKRLLECLCNILTPGGCIMFNVTNALSHVNYQSFTALQFPNAQERLNYLNPDIVESYLKRLINKVSRYQKRGRISQEFLLSLAKQVHSRDMPPEVIASTLDTTAYLYIGTNPNDCIISVFASTPMAALRAVSSSNP